MGMFSEIHAGAEAGRLLLILNRAREDGRWQVIEFARKEVWPLYLDAQGDSWSGPPPEEQTAFWQLADKMEELGSSREAAERDNSSGAPHPGNA